MTSVEFSLIRKTLGLTQQQLAEKLGVDPNTVARWERGERPILKTTELAMNYLTDSAMRLGQGYKATIDRLRLFIEMGPEGKTVSIYDRRKRKAVFRGRPAFSFEGGLEPNLGVFERFALTEAYGLLGRKKRPTNDDLFAVNWVTDSDQKGGN
jgi:transcriptional regulator with XRE-family HTH domain